MTKDAVLDRAVDLARAAAEEVAEHPGDVGEHLGATWEAERLVTHRFACAARGYRGWQWTVTVARVPRGRSATVCEAVLLPGDGALLARPWVPWAERLRPGDLGVGDVLPFRPDDPRLEPGWKPSGDPEADDAALVPVEELALARQRVLAPLGRNETAARWYRGSHGPTTAGALAATAACATCGFLVPVRGALGQLFGVCANEWSPDDGTVVSFDHGCGAHSQTDVDPEPSQWPVPDPLIDDSRIDVVTVDQPDQASSEPADDRQVGTQPDQASTEPADDRQVGTQSDQASIVPADDRQTDALADAVTVDQSEQAPGDLTTDDGPSGGVADQSDQGSADPVDSVEPSPVVLRPAEEVGTMTTDDPTVEPADPTTARPSGEWTGPRLAVDLVDGGHLPPMAIRRSCRVIPPEGSYQDDLVDEAPESAPQE